jgi:hypothetical protein
LGINVNPAKTFLQILSPHINSGNYTVENPTNNIVEVIESFSEPLNITEFTFILSNIIIADTNFNVYEDNTYSIIDESFDYLYYPIKTVHDVNNGNALAAWKVEIVLTGFIYNISNVVNNKLTIANNGTLSNMPVGGLNYKLLDENNNIIFESTTGIYDVLNRGRVVVDPGTGVTNIQELLQGNNYFYIDSTSNQYYIDQYPTETDEFYIDGYVSGDQVGISGKILKRLTYNVGNVNYNKMLLAKPLTFPTFTDPNNPNAIRNSTFKENYLIKINSNYFYSIISEVNISSTDYLYISGRFEDWGTISSGGSSVNYELIQYIENSTTILGNSFDYIDRSSNNLITYQTANSSPFALADFANGPKSVSIQEESIGYTILTRDSKKIEGKI